MDMIGRLILFAAILVAFGVCCVELKARYMGYVYACRNQEMLLQGMSPEKRQAAMEDGVLTMDEVYYDYATTGSIE